MAKHISSIIKNVNEARCILGLTSGKTPLNAEVSRNFSMKRNHRTNSGENIVRNPYPDIEIPHKTYTQLIWERHGQWKNKTAVECGLTGELLNYEQLLEKAENLGDGFLAEGLKQEDVLAFLLPNSPNYVASLLGASRAGLTICSINPLYTPDEIAHQLKNSGAKSIVTYPPKIPDVLKAVRSLSLDGSITGNFQIISTKGLDERKHPLPCGVRSLNEILENGKSKISMNRDINNQLDKRLAFISHSSGTTGLPKGVCLSHQNVTASVLQMAHKETSVFQETDIHQDVIPIVTPIYHNFGLEIAINALYHGSKIVTLPKFDGDIFLYVLRRHKATSLFAVPPMILFLGQKQDVSKEHLQHVRSIFCAAAPIGEEDVVRCLQKAPTDVSFVQGYGQTEAMCCLTFTPRGVKKYTSIGIPVANTQMKVLNLENGSANPKFQEGELCFKGPQMFLGYLKNPKATEEIIDNEGWCHTGDIGYYDTEGHFYVVDRRKELIKVKGYQVAPAELEAVLRTHPLIEEAGVTGMADSRKGEVPVGFIKFKSKVKVSEEELKSFLSEKVAPFKMVEKFIFVESIPKSPSGKILRKDLKLLIKDT